MNDADLDALLQQLRDEQVRLAAQGQVRRCEEYFARYPRLANSPQHALVAIYSEYLIRAEQLGGTSRDEFLQRFPSHRDALQAQFQFYDAVVQRTVAEAETLAPTEFHDEFQEPDLALVSQFGRFDLLGEIGRGRFGVVYRAYDRIRDETVALKILKRIDGNDVARLKREFRSVAGISHPGLATVYDAFSDGAGMFFTMELIDGPPLDLFVREAQTSDRSKLIRDFFVQIVKAVGTLHNNGRVHRDLKPNNILVNQPRGAVLVDFGLVCSGHDPGFIAPTANPPVALRSYWAGTLAYVAPEVLAGRPPSAQSDWYSLGVILFELLEGRPLFQGTWNQVVKQKQDFQVPIRVPELTGTWTRRLCRLTQLLLSPQPEARPRLVNIHRMLEIAQNDSVRPVCMSPPRFIGRERELDWLRIKVAATRRNRPQLVHVIGKSGIGKSALVETFLQRLPAAAYLVFRSRCYQQESIRFQALEGIIAGLVQACQKANLPQPTLSLAELDSMRRMFPEFHRLDWGTSTSKDSIDPLEARRHAVQGLSAVAQSINAGRRLVWWIDDWQWADVESWQLLESLLRRPEFANLVLILSYRSEECEISSTLCRWGASSLLQEWKPDELLVERLSDEDATALIQSKLDSAVSHDDWMLPSLVRQTGGIPILIEQLVHLEPGSPSHQPMTLQAALHRRFNGVSPAGRQILDLLSTALQPLPAEFVRAAAQLSAEQCSRGIEELRSSGLVRISHTATARVLETSHDQVRESLTAEMRHDARELCHRRLADVYIAQLPTVHETIARHLQAAGDTFLAAPYFERAGLDAAAGLAFERAAECYQHAIDLGTWNAAELARLREQLADAWANAGRALQACAIYRTIESDNPATHSRLLRKLGEQLVRGGRFDEGSRVLTTWLREQQIRIPRHRANVVLQIAVELIRLKLFGLKVDLTPMQGTPPDAVPAQRFDWIEQLAGPMVYYDNLRGVMMMLSLPRLASRLSDRRRTSLALAEFASVLSYAAPRHRQRARRLGRQSKTLAVQSGDQAALGTSYMGRSFIELNSGYWARHLPLVQRAAQIWRRQCGGYHWHATLAESYAAWSALRLGRLSDYHAWITQGIQDAQQRGDQFAISLLSGYYGTIANLMEDSVTGAEQANRAGYENIHQQGYNLPQLMSDLGLIYLRLYQRDGPAAWQAAQQCWRSAIRSGTARLDFYAAEILSLRIRAAVLRVRMGESRWLQSARRDLRRLGRIRMVSIPAEYQFYQGLIEISAGELRAGAESLRRAVGLLAAQRMKLGCQAARWQLQQIENKIGDAAERPAPAAWFRAERIVQPWRFAAVFAPALKNE